MILRTNFVKNSSLHTLDISCEFSQNLKKIGSSMKGSGYFFSFHYYVRNGSNLNIFPNGNRCFTFSLKIILCKCISNISLIHTVGYDFFGAVGTCNFYGGLIFDCAM